MSNFTFDAPGSYDDTKYSSYDSMIEAGRMAEVADAERHAQEVKAAYEAEKAEEARKKAELDAAIERSVQHSLRQQQAQRSFRFELRNGQSTIDYDTSMPTVSNKKALGGALFGGIVRDAEAESTFTGVPEQIKNTLDVNIGGINLSYDAAYTLYENGELDEGYFREALNESLRRRGYRAAY